MARKPRNQPKPTDIYVIMSQIDNRFYCWRCKTGNHGQAYKEHALGHHAQTGALFEESLEKKNPPFMYIMESGEMTPQESYSKAIVWTRYFIDAGCDCVSDESFIKRALYLKGSSLELYENIKDVPAVEMMTEARLVKSEYRQRPKDGLRESERSRYRITFDVSKEEHEAIASRAREAETSLALYCKQMALNGKLYHIKDSIVDSEMYGTAIREIGSCQNILRNIVWEIHKTGMYHNSDMQAIQECVEMISDQQKKISDELHRNTLAFLQLNEFKK